MPLPSQRQCDRLRAFGINARTNRLPSLRGITWRTKQRNCNLDVKSNGSYTVSVVGQKRGQVQTPGCTNCIKGKGPFQECVTVQYNDGSYAMGGMCVNCFHHRHGRCSLKPDPPPANAGLQVPVPGQPSAVAQVGPVAPAPPTGQNHPVLQTPSSLPLDTDSSASTSGGNAMPAQILGRSVIVC